MRIEEIRLNGFGKWANVEFRFGAGINLIVADNEAGKSTLLEAIFGLLYGMKKDYVKKAIRREEWQRYLPWSAKAYGGKINYCIDEKHFIIERDFRSDEHRLYDAELFRDRSQSYPMDARKERNYILEQIGLTRSLFEEISRIGMIGIDHHQHMMEWLHQQKGSESEVAASYQEIFSLLEQKKREIGKGDTGKDTRLAQANFRLKEAKDELDRAKESMRQLRNLEERYRQLATEIQSQEETSKIPRIEIEQLQQEREQALLSKQQMERYLQDIERMQIEEEAVLANFTIEDIDVNDSKELHLWLESQQGERGELDLAINRCDENIAKFDEEIKLFEGLLPKLLKSQRDKELLKQKQKVAGRLQGVAIISSLIGFGMIFSLPWYFGIGVWVIALIFFGLSLRTNPNRSRQTAYAKDHEDLDFILGQQKLQQLKQQREELYRTRLQLERSRVKYKEKELYLERFQQIIRRKQELLLNLRVSREVDRQFVERWRVESTLANYNEELMIEAWVNRIKEIHLEIDRLTSLISQQNECMKEQEQLLREMAQLEGEMKNYQLVSLEEKENRYYHAAAEKDEWERKRGIIDLAKQLFQETLEEWNRIISPDLSKKTSEIFSLLTLGKYDQVRADPSDRFRLRVVENNLHAIREEGQFSRGTEQQLYLALRLALVDQYSKEQYLPLFLDDSFTHYDNKRLEQALLYLEKLSLKHQIFLFSCQSREEEMLNKLGIDYFPVQLC